MLAATLNGVALDAGGRVQRPEVAPEVDDLGPAGRLIRDAHDGEIVAAAWMRRWGYRDARVTPIGVDGGIDVVAAAAVAQVKMEAVAAGRPAVQALYGVAQAEQKQGLFFSLAGYTTASKSWAERVGLPLFRFDLQGTPEPTNDAAWRISALPTPASDWRERARDRYWGSVVEEVAGRPDAESLSFDDAMMVAIKYAQRCVALEQVGGDEPGFPPASTFIAVVLGCMSHVDQLRLLLDDVMSQAEFGDQAATHALVTYGGWSAEAATFVLRRAREIDAES